MPRRRTHTWWYQAYVFDDAEQAEHAIDTIHPSVLAQDPKHVVVKAKGRANDTGLDFCRWQRGKHIPYTPRFIAMPRSDEVTTTYLAVRAVEGGGVPSAAMADVRNRYKNALLRRAGALHGRNLL